jgi:lipopolysaccharide export system protein LptC
MTAPSPFDKRSFGPRMKLQDIHSLKERTRIVGRLKYSLPGFALVALSVLIGWPQLKKWYYVDHPTLAQTIAPTMPTLVAGGGAATYPEYNGTDANNQPYTITADHGVEVSADEIDLSNPKMTLHLKAGEVVTLTSTSGTLNKTTNKIRLTGNVTLTHSQGYALVTSQAWIDCNQGNAYGNDPISGDGPMGAIQAKGFRLTERGKRVSFIGGTQLILKTSEGKK